MKGQDRLSRPKRVPGVRIPREPLFATYYVFVALDILGRKRLSMQIESNAVVKAT